MMSGQTRLHLPAVVLALFASFPALGQTQFKEEFKVTPALPGETFTGSQLFDIDGDGRQDVALTLFDTTGHHWRLLVYSQTGVLLQGATGIVPTEEVSWRGKLCRLGNQVMLFSAGSRLDVPDTIGYLTVRAYDFPSLALRDTVRLTRATTKMQVEALEPVASDAAVTVLAAASVHDADDPWVNYPLFHDDALLAAATFAGGRFTATETLDNLGLNLSVELPGRVLCSGFSYSNTGGGSYSVTRTLAELAPRIPLTATIRRHFTFTSQPKGGAGGTADLTPFFASYPPGGGIPIMLFSRQDVTMTGPGTEIFHGLDPGNLADLWSDTTWITNPFFYTPVHYSVGGYVVAQDTVPGKLTRVLLAYGKGGSLSHGFFRVISTTDGRVLQTEPAAFTPVAVLSDTTGFRFFLSLDSGIFRLLSVEGPILEKTPSAPELVFPPNGGFAPTDTVTLRWFSSPRARLYKVHVEGEEPPPYSQRRTLYDVQVSDTTFTFIGTRRYVYFWRVTANNSAGDAASPAFTFQTMPYPPGSPVIYWPPSGTTGSTLPLSLWYTPATLSDPRPVFTSMRLQVKGDTSFSAGDLIIDEVRKMNRDPYLDSLRFLPPRSRYYWRLEAVNQSGAAWSQPAWFSLKDGGAVYPTCTETVDTLSNGTSLKATLTWNWMTGLSAYRVRIYEKTTMLVDTTLIVNSYLFAGTKGKSYSWRLAFYDLDPFAGEIWTWFDRRFFGADPGRDPGDGSPDGGPYEFALLQNYPNPFNPTTTIGYSLPHRTHATLTVFNTLGQKVVELVNGAIDAGYHEVQFNANNLASGVYFYRLQAGAFVQAKSLIIVK